MSISEEPLVSVVTPVYNGETHLAECIESVLAQTYSNWEYLIVNNASTDDTLKIAERYAHLDKRIRVHSNQKLLGIIANHNRAFRLISKDSMYCKVVSADDWLFPECLSRMVSLAENHPSVGIVGSYQLSGSANDLQSWKVRWGQVPYPGELISGREICRWNLLHGPYGFGTPTSLLYRASLIHHQETFYPNDSGEADTSACIKYLQRSDFGFVHQVLSYERVHDIRQTSKSQALNSYFPSQASDLIEYGAAYLSPQELNDRIEELMGEYYTFLATNLLFRYNDKSFWEFHREKLNRLGYPLSGARITNGAYLKLKEWTKRIKQKARRARKPGGFPA